MESAVREKHLCRYMEQFCSESPWKSINTAPWDAFSKELLFREERKWLTSSKGRARNRKTLQREQAPAVNQLAAHVFLIRSTAFNCQHLSALCPSSCCMLLASVLLTVSVLVMLQEFELLYFLLNSYFISFTLDLFHIKLYIWVFLGPGLVGKQ